LLSLEPKVKLKKKKKNPVGLFGKREGGPTDRGNGKGVLKESSGEVNVMKAHYVHI
jgi:hypothetical protein